MTLPDDLRQRNARTARLVMLAVAAMTGLAFASVPLYDLFCRVTGFGGTPQVADSAPAQVLDRMVTVKFNTDTAMDLPWSFKAERREVTTPIGKKTLINFRAANESARPVAGTALYNVTPPKVGKYFHKIECFCFGEQILAPGERMNMPVVFFVDPELANDPDMADVTTITLSYSFFRTESETLEQALEAFYNQPAAAAGRAGQGS